MVKVGRVFLGEICCRRKRRREKGGENVRNGEGWKDIYRGNGCLGCIYT